MRCCASILLLGWVFVIAPGVCLGAIGMYDHACHDSRCTDCTSSSHEDSHHCQHDPCTKDAVRTENDDEGTAFGPAWPSAAAAEIHCPAAAATRTVDRDRSSLDDILAFSIGSTLRALAGLPLLI